MDTAAWALRLMQCLLAVAYFSAGSGKLLDGGLYWMNGATLQQIVLTDYVRFGMPAGLWLAQSFWLCVAGAVMTVVVGDVLLRRRLRDEVAEVHAGGRGRAAPGHLRHDGGAVLHVDGALRRLRGLRGAAAEGGQEAQIRLGNASPSRGAADRVHQLVEPLQLPDEHADIVGRAGDRGCGGQLRAPGRIPEQRDDGPRQPSGVPLRHDDRVPVVVEDVGEAVGVGRDDRAAGRERLERRERRPFPQGRERHHVERRESAGDVAREAGEPHPAGDAEALGERLEVAPQLALADYAEVSVGRLVENDPGRLDEGTRCPSEASAG